MVLKRIVFGMVAATVLAMLATPWLIYAIALSNVIGRPELPVVVATPEQMQTIWKRAHGSGTPPESMPLTPYAYLRPLLAGTNYYLRGEADQALLVVASLVARNHNSDHLRNSRTIWWHFSGAALTIWLTRNWRTEQILSRVAEIDAQHARIMKRQAAKR